MPGELYVVGEDIPAGSGVVRALIGGKLYATGATAGEYIGDAVENLREGFRAVERDGEVREDDA